MEGFIDKIDVEVVNNRCVLEALHGLVRNAIRAPPVSVTRIMTG